METSRIIKYVLGTVVIGIIAALLLWFFLLRGRIGEIAQNDTARGAFTETPTFSFGGGGSNYENIVSSSDFAATEEDGSEQVASGPRARLTQISKTPTAGAGFILSGTSTSLRFVERSTGYILEAAVSETGLRRLTNTLIPRIYDAVVGSKTIFMQTLEDNALVTLVGEVVASSSPQASASIITKRLPDGIHSFAIDPLGKNILYIRSGEGGASGIKRDIASGKETNVFTSRIHGWRIEWLPSGRILLWQNPSANVSGYLYEVQTNGTLAPLMRDVPGLTVRPHTSAQALLFGNSSSELSLYARVGEASSITLPVRTVPEKCVWHPANTLILFCGVPRTQPPMPFLERWYRGEVHTSDEWWRIDVRANTAESLFSPGTALDVEKPAIDESGSYISFLNRTDKSLWLLRIAQ